VRKRLWPDARDSARVTARLLSLLDHALELRERLTPPSLIALDFDGTLTEIVDDPAAPRLTPERRLVLGNVADSGRRLAVVSGRALKDVRDRVGIDRAIYVGNHGLEIEGAGFEERVAEAAELTARVTRTLEALPPLDGAFIEDKSLTATVHIRPREDEARITAVGLKIRDIVEAEGLILRRGKASWEIRPPGPHTKAEAVERLIALIPGARVERTLYAGDDVTDEDAFRVIRGGVTVRIGEADALTAARYFLPSPTALYTVLERLLAS
jgi:trehalose 6-phosphate phosphatase